MRTNWLFKTQTGVIAILVAIFASPYFSSAQSTQNSGSGIDFNKILERGLSSGGNFCSATAKEISTGIKDLQEACSKAYGSTIDPKECYRQEKFKECAAEYSTFEENLSDFEDEEDDGGSGKKLDCQTVREYMKKCPGYVPVNLENAKSELKDYTRDLKDLQSERDKSKKESEEKRQKMQEDLNKLDDDALNADKDWQKTRQELNERIQKEIAQGENEKTRAQAETKKKMDEIDVEYIKLRDKLRRNESNLAVLNATWNIQCRTAADAAARTMEVEFDRRLAEEKKLIRNYSLSSSARKMSTQLKQKRQKIVNKYNETLSSCLSGATNPGAEIKAKIAAATTERTDTTALTNDQASRLEKIRRESIESLQSIIQSLETQKQQTVMNLQNQINTLDQNHQTGGNRRQMRKMQSMQNMQTQMSNADKEAHNITEKINAHRKERTAGINLAKCGIPSKDELKEAREGLSKMSGGIGHLKTLCRDFHQSCPGKPRSSDPKVDYGKFTEVSECNILLKGEPLTQPARSTEIPVDTPSGTPAPPAPSSPAPPAAIVEGRA